MAQEELEPTVLEGELEDLNRRMDRLRVLYEQYFQGIERTPPLNLQKDIVRIIHRLSQVRMRSTTHKFRYQSLIQRFSAHKTYWARTMREIEEGRYTRHTVRVDRRSHRVRSAENVEGAAVNTTEDDAAQAFMEQLGVVAPRPAAPAAEPVSIDSIRGVSADDLAKRADKLRALRARLGGGSADAGAAASTASAGASAPASTAASAAAARPAPAAPVARPDPEEARARQVYERLLETKRRLNEPTDSLGFDSVRQSLARQAERTREKHGCRDVDFDVVVKDGKAFLKPIPR